MADPMPGACLPGACLPGACLPGPSLPGARMLARLLAPDGGPWRDLFEAGPWGAAVLDTGGRILLANRALAALAGVDSALRLVGLDFAILFAPAERDALAAAQAGALAPDFQAPGVPVVADLPATPGAEQAAAAMIAFTPITPEGGGAAEGVVVRVVDVTAQRRLEQQLAQAQKMHAIGQLAGGIAHDFNNYLTAILLTADEAARHVGPTSAVAGELAQIRRSTERGAALVRKLLAFGRKQPMQARVIVLNDAIEELSMLLRRLLGARVSLVLDLDPPRRAVRVDPTQFDQVIVNLAVNARDAMPRGGRLTLRTGQVNLFRPLVRGRETIPPGRYAMVEVDDTGTGIPESYLDRIFEPFFTTRKDSGGTGLGLATVWGIVRQMEGFVAVDSTPGEGTTFRVYLPRVDGIEDSESPPRPALSTARDALPWPAPEPTSGPTPEPVPEQVPEQVPELVREQVPELVREQVNGRVPEPAAAAQASRGPVLVAEDEDTVRKLAAKALSREGWEVVQAACGDEALALIAARTTPLAALVTDMVMPGADGEAVVRAARSRWPELPVIVTSGYAETLGGEGLGRLGVAWLAKPYTMRDLGRAATRLVGPCAAGASPDPDRAGD